MGGIYARGRKLWLRYKDADGRWRSAPSGLHVGQEAAARKLLEKLKAKIRAGLDLSNEGPVLVRTYGKRWLEDRRQRGLRSVADDEGRLNRHIYPAIGHLEITQVRPKHIVDLIRKLEGQREHAPRTIRNIYSVVRNLFTDAIVAELIDTSPCVLKRHHLPPNVDEDPGWRETAVFSPGEVEAIISDSRIPWVRRTLYAMLALAGPRVSEAVARRWRDVNPDLQPLGKLSVVTNYNTRLKKEVSATKVSGVVRYVPIHPTLAAVLAAWKRDGWPDMVGREPIDDDLILPSPRGSFLGNSVVYRHFQEDLARLGFRRRRVHDLRRAFISMARSAGAREDIIRWVTHGPGKKIVDIYTSFPWEVLCAEVAKVRVTLRTSNVAALRTPASGPLATLATVTDQNQQNETNTERPGARAND